MAAWPFRSIETILQDLRYARRILRRNPGFTATTIATLALGIGASTAIFSVVDAVLLKPLSYKDSERIYRIHTMNPQGRPLGEVGPAYIDPMAGSGPAIQAAAYGYSHETSVLNRAGTAFAINEYRVSGHFFRVFTDPLTLGRGFRPGDNYMKTVLSYQVWRDVFDSDPHIVGSVIRVNGSPLTVIGVAGKGFEFPVGTGIWTKIFTSPAITKSLFNMEGYLRVRPGVSRSQLQAQLNVLATRLGPTPDGRPLQFVVRSLLADVVGDFSSTLLIISGATGILLLIACLNVANLLFTRGTVRGTEIAMRVALGAGTKRMFRQLMTETLLLCALGGALGLGLAVAAIRVLRAAEPGDLPRFAGVSVNLTAFLFAAACVLLTALLVGFVPALRSARGNLSSLINQGGRSGSAGPGRNRIFGALVVAEIALAVVLVIGAGLLVKSYSRLLSTDPGFNPGRMLTLLLNVPDRPDIRAVTRGPDGKLTYQGTGYLTIARFYEHLIDRIRALPGVESAGATSGAPLRPGLFPVTLDSYQVVGDSSPGASRPAYTNQVTPGFFTVLGLHAAAGRLLKPADRRNTRGVAVVNQTFARAYCGGVHCVGRDVRLPGPGFWNIGGLAFQLGERVVDEARIVGVVPDVKQGSLSDPVQPAIYVPLEQWTLRRMAVLVRSKTDAPGKLIPAIRRQVAALDPKVPPVFAVYSDVIAASVARQRLGMLVLVAFGLVSLVLAAVGIYGVVSYSASQRTSELAVRSAFGAEQRHLLELFLARGLRLAGIGIVLGVAGALALRQVVASQLYEVSTLDPEVFAAVPLSLLLVALLASYMPARRAAKMDPFTALRED